MAELLFTVAGAFAKRFDRVMDLPLIPELIITSGAGGEVALGEAVLGVDATVVLDVVEAGVVDCVAGIA